MDFTANKRALAGAVARVAPMAGAPSGDLPGVRIDASHDGSGQFARVSAGDGAVAHAVRVAADVARAGSFTAEAATLRKALGGGRARDTATVTVDRGERAIGGPDTEATIRAWVASGGIRVAIASAEPPVPVEIAAGGARAVWPLAELGERLRRVSFAMAGDDDLRHYLRGVFVLDADGKAAFVATDGHRLAFTDSALTTGAEDWPENGGGGGARGLIVPALAVRALERMCAADADGDGRAYVRIAATGLEIEGRDATLTTRAIDGTFPDFKRVFPDTEAEGRARTTFDLGAFAAAIRAAKPAERDTVLLNGYATVGETTSIEGGPNIEGEGIRFNARYLAEIGRAFGGPATLDYGASGDAVGSPALLSSPDIPGYVALLMPMRA